MTGRSVSLTSVVDEPDVVIRRGGIDGAAGRPIVVFASAGRNARSGDRMEMIGLIAKLGRPAIFVMDPNRSWYAHAGMADRISGVISDEIASSGVDFVDTIGNSMGAFGAVAFADRLPVHTAIAFSPRFSPDARVIPDRRLGKYLSRYRDHFPVSTLAAGLSAAKEVFVLHGTHAPDLPHVLAFADAMAGRNWVLPEPRHDVAMVLRETASLLPLVTSVLNGNRRRTATLLSSSGARRAGAMRKEIEALVWREGRDADAWPDHEISAAMDG